MLGAYREPLGGNPVLFASLPIDKVEPTPFQRDLSEAHHKKLAGVIDKTGLFLDPVIAITAPEKGFWTPNGRHRLAALQRLGAKAITALVVPKREIAWQILALNTEKAHNLQERSLEVIRIYKGLLDEDDARPESDFAFYLEEAALVTLGPVLREEGQFRGRRLLPDPAPPGNLLGRLAEEGDRGARKARRHGLRAGREGRGGGGQAEGQGPGQPLPARPSSSRASTRCAGSRASCRRSRKCSRPCATGRRSSTPTRSSRKTWPRPAACRTTSRERLERIRSELDMTDECIGRRPP